MNKYQICKRCVMDTTDKDIRFDAKGICNHCNRYDNILVHQWKKDGFQEILNIAENIKMNQKNQKYDCIIGLSGGIDSSYLLYFATKKLNLRVLAVHIDAGWNSISAVNNIEKLVKKLNVDLHTIVIDWEEMKDLQLSFLKSGVANCDAPQDHAFFSALYQFSIKQKIKYVLTGSNIATESVLPFSWEHFAMDSIQLKDIHKKFGSKKLKTFPVTSFFKYYFYYPYIKKQEIIAPLNYIKYSKKEAIQVLKSKFSWEEYGAKHNESVWTKFFQNYFLPKKFNFDKRKAHLSSLILSEEITRDEAIEELNKPLYKSDELEQDLQYIKNKLNLNDKEWEDIFNLPTKHYTNYKNNENLYQFKKKYFDPILN